MSETVQIILTKKIPELKAPGMNVAQMTRLGGYAIARLLHRVRDLHQDLTDSPAKPYSPAGPVYVPIYGAGTFTRGETTMKRTKTNLGGRAGLGQPDLKRLATADGARTPSGKSMKYAGRADYKRALGKSGERDLEESGRMLGAIGIVSVSDTHVEIGFLREEEHQKALGNQQIDEWFGFSPGDQEVVEAYAEELFHQDVAFLPGV